MNKEVCQNGHRYFIGETAATDTEVHLFVVCTVCGETLHRKFEVLKAQLKGE